MIAESFAWFFDPANWSGSNGLGHHTLVHLGLSLVALVLTAVVAIPLGWIVSHRGKGAHFLIAASGALRAVPTLGVITLVALATGIGALSPLLGLVILAFPTVLVATHSAITSIPDDILDAATAQGFTTGQLVWNVHLPLGFTRMLGGLRSGMIQILSTAILAAYVGAGGLGRFIFLGLNSQNYPMMLATAVWVIILILVTDALFALVQRLLTPAGVRLNI